MIARFLEHDLVYCHHQSHQYQYLEKNKKNKKNKKRFQILILNSNRLRVEL